MRQGFKLRLRLDEEKGLTIGRLSRSPSVTPPLTHHHHNTHQTTSKSIRISFSHLIYFKASFNTNQAPLLSAI
ncbi:hypothetical protein O181_054598 [Austropuccinia psidii MF-1]|uniref:Uncharacterized protein n=1 Tax=Austropuccinia psidii MF-1 TaxID=1389203 RepID=A0A9Q3HRK8_9BASI|nr:hypothetical protein [Austropuccinia psidii MF-1]